MNNNDAITPETFDDELLSAYLDEQLSGEERARVESHLAENVEARQLLGELTAVSVAVGSLPKLTVDARFASDVLRDSSKTGEPEVSASGTPDQPAYTGRSPGILLEPLNSPRPAEGTASPIETRPTISVGRSARGWVWAALAVAAALLVMFLNGDWTGENLEVAEIEGPVDESVSVAVVREKSADSDHASIESDEESEHAEELFAWGVGELTKPAAKTLAMAETGAEEDRGKGGPVVPASEAPAIDRPASPRSKSDGLLAGRGGEMSVPSDAPEGMQTAKAAPRGFQQAPGAMRGRVIEQDKDVQSFLAANNITLAENETVLVVQVDLTPEAARSQAFDAVLIRNSISYEYEKNEDKKLDRFGLDATAKVTGLTRDLKDASPGSQLAGNANAGQSEFETVPDQSSNASPGEEAAADHYEVVLIDATPTQLHASLNEINSDRGNYSQLQIAPSSEIGETANTWGQYSRGQVVGEQATRRGLNRASGVQRPPSDGGVGGERYGLAADDSLQQPGERTQSRAWRFRVDQNQRDGRKMPEGGGFGVFQDSDSNQDSQIRQEHASFGERPLIQLEQQLRSSLSGGRPIRQKASKDHIWAVFLLRVAPRQAEAAVEPADES